MARTLDKILVIDVESTCWQGNPPAGETSEIIEIGVAVLDLATLDLLDGESLLVMPARSHVSDFCTHLTTLTPEQVANGQSFEAACRHLKEAWLAPERTWASYGDYDRRMFERQCREMKVPFPFGPTHLNVKNLMALSYGLPQELGMAEALEHMGLKLEGTHHRGVDDAANIARILTALLARLRA